MIGRTENPGSNATRGPFKIGIPWAGSLPQSLRILRRAIAAVRPSETASRRHRSVPQQTDRHAPWRPFMGKSQSGTLRRPSVHFARLTTLAMRQPAPSGALESGSREVLWQDGERVLSRVWRTDADGSPDVVLTVTFTTDQPTPASLERLAHEYGLRNELDTAWAVRPLELKHDGGRLLLVLEDPGGEPLEQRVLCRPMEIGAFPAPRHRYQRGSRPKSTGTA